MGVKPRLYRPPHRKLSLWEINYVHKAGMIEVTWTLETAELGRQSGNQEANQIIQRICPGDLVLLYDGYGIEHGDKHADKNATVEVVKIMILQLESEGYIFVTVPELLGTTAYLN